MKKVSYYTLFLLFFITCIFGIYFAIPKFQQVQSLMDSSGFIKLLTIFYFISFLMNTILIFIFVLIKHALGKGRIKYKSLCFVLYVFIIGPIFAFSLFSIISYGVSTYIFTWKEEKVFNLENDIIRNFVLIKQLEKRETTALRNII